MVIPNINIPGDESNRLLQIYKNKLEQQNREINQLKEMIEDLKNTNHKIKLENVEKMVRNSASVKTPNVDLLKVELEEAQ